MKKGSKVGSVNPKLILILILISIGMFGFTFALVPLYNVFCSITGLNGKVDTQHPGTYTRYKTKEGIPERLITVELDVTLNRSQNMNCEFKAEHTVLQVKPGELTHTSYLVKNLSNKTLILQAIPSISPNIAAKYLKKLECFCFNKQVIKPHQTLRLPLRFWLEPELPHSVHRLTLSYTLFDITEQNKGDLS